MVTLNIYLRIHNKTSDSGTVYISFYVNREKINFSTSISVNINDWNKDKSRVKRSDKNHEDKNRIIENFAARINNIFVKYRLRDKTLTRSAFLKAYNRPDDYATFHDFVKANKSTINSGNELSTMQSHNKVLKKVKDYAPNLHFDDITPEWLADYFRYLRRDLKNNENTAYKDMSTFKKYVRAAVKMGYMNESPFDEFKIKKIPGSFTYLSESELQIFVNSYTEGFFEAKYHCVLEFFLFMCFSSLHVTDARNLSLEQFTEKSFTYYRIKTRNSKPKPIIVPISEPLRQIIRNIVGTRKKGKVFHDLPADQTMNRYLKDIVAELEIKKVITHKTGRHTFATYFLAKTKDITALQKILGHSSLSETMVYAHVMDESKQEGIICFNKFSE
jgi:site-specific recombinase XerD